MEIFLFKARHQGSSRQRGAQLSTVSARPSIPARRRTFRCKCLTGKGFFDVIVGFPDARTQQHLSCVSHEEQV